MTTPLQHTSLGELGGYTPLLASSLGELSSGVVGAVVLRIRDFMARITRISEEEVRK